MISLDTDPEMIDEQENCHNGGELNETLTTIGEGMPKDVSELATSATVNENDVGSSKDLKSKRRRSSSGPAPFIPTLYLADSLPHVGKKKKKKSSAPAGILNMDSHSKTEYSVKDLRDLSLFLLGASDTNVKWTSLRKNDVDKVIVFFSPGLLPEDYHIEPSAHFRSDELDLKSQNFFEMDPKHDRNSIEHCINIPVTAPGSRLSVFSPYSAFINVKLNKRERLMKTEELQKKKITIHDLMMDVDQMLENDIPIHLETSNLPVDLREELKVLYSKPEMKQKWVDTKKFEHKGSTIFGLDCEMCLTAKGLVVTRVSILNFEGKVLYDELIKPEFEILDYLTKYSGITKEKLDEATKSLETTQQDILKIVSSEDILIGHSIQSDLDVLHLRHPKIVDTSLIYEHKAGAPFRPGLKYLANEYLSKEIQIEKSAGHDSVEDALTCIELVKSKIEHGLTFGVSINTENLLHRLSRFGLKSLQLMDTAPRQHLRRHESLESSIRCVSDQQITDEVKYNLKDYNFIIARLRGLEFARKYTQPKSGMSKEHIPNISCSAEEAVNFLKRSLKEIYELAPPKTLIMLLSGGGDTRDYSKIMKTLNAVDKDDRPQLKQTLEKKLEAAVLKARDGVASLFYKYDSADPKRA